MAELTDPAGQPVEAERAGIEREFAAAMAADANGNEPAAPPKRKPAEDKPAPRRRGRPPKSEKARVAAGQASVLTDEQRADGVRGLVQVGAGVCLLASRAAGKEKDGKTEKPAAVAFRADAITLASNADELAAACVQVARQDEKFARIIDKIAGAGPYGALITAGMGVAMQIARNHRPAAALPGTMDPAEMIRQAEAPAGPEQMAA